jgi:hypothetical protein
MVARSGAAPRLTGLYSRGAGGNRTPVRRAVADRATTVPEIYGSAAAAPPGRWASRRRPPPGLSPMSAVFPAASGLSRRQPSLLLPGCGGQAPRAITGRWCSRSPGLSGGDSELLVGSCVCAPFKESEQLRSHDSASGLNVETDQPLVKQPDKCTGHPRPALRPCPHGFAPPLRPLARC